MKEGTYEINLTSMRNIELTLIAGSIVDQQRKKGIVKEMYVGE
jgi:hypothetical protein